MVELDVTPGLHEWINGEILRRAEVARECQQNSHAWAYDEASREIRELANAGTVARVYRHGTGIFIAANDPESVLRRCHADLMLLAAHPYTTEVAPPLAGQPSAGFGCTTCHRAWDEYGGEDIEGRGNCPSILALAEAYGLDEQQGAT
ncbi:DUF6221 family protein [Streptomyces sp. NPDC047097]|uniref:DUF6221 family protein n=1 Tax=Streptomyces sp. NPDC047097 TaxID=3155260 RepID=UPI0033EC4B6F